MKFSFSGAHVIATADLCTEQRKSPTQRATYEYLKGKILDVVPEYRKDAEDHLSKAVSKNRQLKIFVV